MADVLWENKTPEEKKVQLYLNQKRTLELFVERNAITREQYEKSLRDLTEKMGMGELLESNAQY